MNKWIILFSLLTNLTLIKTHAQVNKEETRQLLEDGTEISAEEINESGQTELPQELIDLLDHPLNLNKDNCEILVLLNLLTQIQLTSLNEYLKIKGKLVELEELQQVDGFDKKTIQNIIPYCTIISSKKEQDYHQITLRIQSSPNKSNENYSGPNSKILVKYKTQLSSVLNISLTSEKDAGEEFFTHGKKGFDFNSFNIVYKGKSLLKKLIAGDYNIEYGQGLTAWTGLNFGSGSNITGIYKSGRGIFPYSGTDENRFYRGIALSLGKNKICVDTWFSNHAIDANKERDTLSKEEFISSLQTSGYHRTTSEIENKHSQKETAFGSSLKYTSENLTMGFILSAQHYLIPLKKSNKPYTKHEFNGTNNLNLGGYYTLTYKNILLFGETTHNNNSIASLNGILLSLDPRLSIGILWRSYSQKFISLKSNAFGVNTKNTNEHGNYLGLIYKINKIITYSGYTDIYSFPFLKYRINKPSYGFDFFQQLEFTPSKKFKAQLRYRRKLKQLNDEIPDFKLKYLSDLYYNNIRVSARFKIDNSWEYSFRIEYNLENKMKIRIGNGTLVSQDLFYHPMGKPYSANCRYAVFNCPQFENRIYEYENDVQGAFSIPFYYGTGSRFYTNLNYKISSGITISVKYAVSWIDDPLATNEKSEIKLQLKTTFR